MAAVLGLCSALAYGVSDFYAGLLSRRAHFLTVALVSQVGALATSLLAVALTGPPAPGGGVVGWGALAGSGGAIGTLALYRGLGRGRMSVVGPVSGVGAATLPVLVGVALGERPPPLAAAGVLVALPAVWLVARTPSTGPPAGSGLVDGLVAGAGFGVLFVGLGRAGDGYGIWPVVAAQVAGLVVLAVAGAVVRPALAGAGVAGSAAVGALSTAAVVSYLLAVNRGLLTLVAVLSSLYPAVTVVLARVILREHIAALQGAGLALAALAVVAIVLG